MQLENKIRYDNSAILDLVSLIAEPLLSERAIVLDGHPTPVVLENIVWEGLDEVAWREGRTVADLCDELETNLAGDASIDSAIRDYVLNYFREAGRR